jgi:hypothetical protein
VNRTVKEKTMVGARLASMIAVVMAVALASAGCGSVTAGGDGGAGQTGRGGSTGGAGHGGAGGSTGEAGASGGTTGAAGQGGVSGGAGQGGSGGGGPRDAGGDAADAGNPCHGLTEAQCGANPACAAGTCASCNGGQSYAGCYRPSTEGPPACPGIACPLPCAGLVEAACVARTDCRADYCPGCQAKTFVQCARPSDGLPACPAIKCLLPCAMVTTLVACEARGDCHSVFVDPGTCGCAVSGCCAKFSRCADGDTGMCTGTPACTAATPFCESPYVVAYTATCYEGCVQKKDCAP